ncbi:LAFE_0F06018g1_1 [Lachancea fermentati]|uniref:Cytochrome c oxidase-assembly factor COX23, mitochondrial n=1 Tax=Lachancea fermentati TaxID=4955 RepID=A0A1G4MF99_LACFM|nr:LAFE_0F06018g1_1 [Lachancea fermentati]
MSDNTPKKDSIPENVDPQLQTDKQKVNFTPESTDVNSFKYYPDNPESILNKYRFAAKDASRFYDPCQESSKMSMKCLELNNYDKEMCKEYFDAYRECKKQWLQARRKDRSQWE